jgi:Spherulation-specific family 4
MESLASDHRCVDPSSRPVRSRLLRSGLAGLIAVTLALFGLGATAGQPASAATTLSIGVPAGFFPSERDYPGSTRPMWNRLAAAGPNVGLVAIIDPGPPSIDYVDFVARQQTMGQRVVVELPAANYHARLLALREWLPVNGVLITDAATDCSNVAPTQLAATRALDLIVAADAGLAPASCWKQSVDTLVLRSSWNGVAVPAPPSWWSSTDSPELWVLQFSVPLFAINSAVTSARSQSARYVFTTPDPAIDESRLIPEASYWDVLVQTATGSLPRLGDPVSDSPRQQMAMPLYGPSHPSWNLVAMSGARTVPYVAVNVANGPGASALPNLRAHIDAARAGGTKVLGYLHTAYGQRANSLSIAEAQQWVSFYGVDGFFIDELFPECAGEPTVRELVSSLRVVRPNAMVVLNPGRNISECFAKSSGADAILVFEGTAASFMSWTPSPWTYRYPSTMFWHMVFATSPADLRAVANRSRGQHAAMLYVNTLAFPTQWEADIAPGSFASLADYNRQPPPRRAATPVPAAPSTGPPTTRVAASPAPAGDSGPTPTTRLTASQVPSTAQSPAPVETSSLPPELPLPTSLPPLLPAPQ